MFIHQFSICAMLSLSLHLYSCVLLFYFCFNFISLCSALNLKWEDSTIKIFISQTILLLFYVTMAEVWKWTRNSLHHPCAFIEHSFCEATLFYFNNFLSKVNICFLIFYSCFQLGIGVRLIVQCYGRTIYVVLRILAITCRIFLIT